MLIRDQATVPLRLFSNVMTLHWYNVNVNKINQHCWNCVPLTPVTLWWHFPLATDVSKYFIGRHCFHYHCCCREQPFVHCDVTGRSPQVSTSMFCECFILIFKQAWNISIKWKCLSMSFNKCTTHVLGLFSFIFTKSRMSTPQCHEIHVMTFDAKCHEICFVGRETNVLTLRSWDLENVMRLIFSWMGARFGQNRPAHEIPMRYLSQIINS